MTVRRLAVAVIIVVVALGGWFLTASWLTTAGEEGLGEARLLLAGYSVLIALVAGLSVALVATVGRTSTRRLTRSMERVTATGDLRPVPETSGGELTRSFNRMLASLRESRSRQERRITEIGHDLRNPLTALRVNVELLLSLHRDGQSRALPPEEHRELERDVLTQLDEFAGLIDDLVGLSGEDSGPVRFDAVVETACERARCRRGDVEIQVATTPWLVRGDGGALGRGVINLVDNAVKWSPSGGTVRVRLARDGDRRAVLTVADSGPGVDPGEHDRIFDRFYRPPDVRDTPGLGLGLAIVKEAVEDVGGRIDVSESGDGGALFTAEVPGSPG